MAAPKPDHGADLGPAAQARPSRIVRTEGRAVAGRHVDEARRYDVAHPLDAYLRMCLIVDRQHAAGMELARRWRADRWVQRVTASYGQARGIEHVPEERAERARREWLDLIDAVPADCRMVCIRVCCVPDGEAGLWATQVVSGGLGLFRRGLTAAADHLWGRGNEAPESAYWGEEEE